MAMVTDHQLVHLRCWNHPDDILLYKLGTAVAFGSPVLGCIRFFLSFPCQEYVIFVSRYVAEEIRKEVAKDPEAKAKLRRSSTRIAHGLGCAKRELG
jgi:hypothetical protein